MGLLCQVPSSSWSPCYFLVSWEHFSVSGPKSALCCTRLWLCLLTYWPNREREGKERKKPHGGLVPAFGNGGTIACRGRFLSLIVSAPEGVCDYRKIAEGWSIEEGRKGEGKEGKGEGGGKEKRKEKQSISTLSLSIRTSLSSVGARTRRHLWELSCLHTGAHFWCVNHEFEGQGIWFGGISNSGLLSQSTATVYFSGLK